MSAFSNFLIYLSNLSDIYILSSVTVALAIAVTLYYTNYMKTGVKVMNNEKIDPDAMDRKEFVGKNKTVQLKEIEKSLTEDQIKEERRIEQAQLAAIYELLKKQEVELNTVEIDEQELKEQLNLYR